VPYKAEKEFDNTEMPTDSTEGESMGGDRVVTTAHQSPRVLRARGTGYVRSMWGRHAEP
jgi:hypothetical protein